MYFATQACVNKIRVQICVKQGLEKLKSGEIASENQFWVGLL
jgi:hypothetical protein